MPDIRVMGAIMHVAGGYKPYDPPPAGYLDWHEWAQVQHKAGLRPLECGRCGKYKYPQELIAEVRTFTAKNSRGKPVTIEYRICIACGAEKEPTEKEQ